MSWGDKDKQTHYLDGTLPKIGDFVKKSAPKGTMYGIVAGFSCTYEGIPKVLWANGPHSDERMQLASWLTPLSRINGDTK